MVSREIPPNIKNSITVLHKLSQIIEIKNKGGILTHFMKNNLDSKMPSKNRKIIGQIHSTPIIFLKTVTKSKLNFYKPATESNHTVYNK